MTLTIPSLSSLWNGWIERRRAIREAKADVRRTTNDVCALQEAYRFFRLRQDTQRAAKTLKLLTRAQTIRLAAENAFQEAKR